MPEPKREQRDPENQKTHTAPDVAERLAGLSPKPAGPEPPGTGYASHPAAGTGPTDMGAPEGPETERGGSPQSTSRLNEPEDRQ